MNTLTFHSVAKVLSADAVACLFSRQSRAERRNVQSHTLSTNLPASIPESQREELEALVYSFLLQPENLLSKNAQSLAEDAGVQFQAVIEPEVLLSHYELTCLKLSLLFRRIGDLLGSAIYRPNHRYLAAQQIHNRTMKESYRQAREKAAILLHQTISQ